MKIGIDLDEILAEFLTAAIQYHNNIYNTNFTKEQFHSYKFWEV